MRVLFDAAQLTERGTSVATFDYARGCSGLLGIEPIILFDRRAEHDPGARQRFAASFELVGYDRPEDIADIGRTRGADIYYKLKYDYQDRFRPQGLFSAIHCAFDFDQPHGEVYAYVSEWLSAHASAGRRPFVPHIVDLPEPRSGLRHEWQIPEHALVIGRYGGYDTFDIAFAQDAVRAALERRPDIWFVFVNTRPFATHPRLHFLPAIHDPQEKADYIHACDIMLHARTIGETFGLAIAEFAYGNRPFLCWNGGRDRNHLRLQTRPDFIYRNGRDLLGKTVDLSQDRLHPPRRPLAQLHPRSRDAPL